MLNLVRETSTFLFRHVIFTCGITILYVEFTWINYMCYIFLNRSFHLRYLRLKQANDKHVARPSIDPKQLHFSQPKTNRNLKVQQSYRILCINKSTESWQRTSDWCYKSSTFIGGGRLDWVGEANVDILGYFKIMELIASVAPQQSLKMSLK